MTALAAASIGASWQQFTKMAEAALSHTGLLQGPAQWFLAEQDNDSARCTFSAGAGPLQLHATINWPLPQSPVCHENGYLVGSPLAAPGTPANGYLGLWLPDDQGPPCDTDLALLQAKAILITID